MSSVALRLLCSRMSSATASLLVPMKRALSPRQARWETVLKPLVADNGGTVVKFMGAGALVEFPSAVDPVRAVLFLQQRMAKLNSEQPEAPPIRLRIRIKLGDVISHDNDIFRRRREHRGAAGGAFQARRDLHFP